MKKLISMTDFVLEATLDKTIKSSGVGYTLARINKYANFLKQPLELWMFVPCDEDGNVLEQPCDIMNTDGCRDCACRVFIKAKERCFFEGFEVGIYPLERFLMHKNDFGLVIDDLKRQTIEDLVKYNIQLTPTALKQIGL